MFERLCNLSLFTFCRNIFVCGLEDFDIAFQAVLGSPCRCQLNLEFFHLLSHCHNICIQSLKLRRESRLPRFVERRLE